MAHTTSTKYVAFQSKDEVLAMLRDHIDGAVLITWDTLQQLNNTDTAAWASGTTTLIDAGLGATVNPTYATKAEFLNMIHDHVASGVPITWHELQRLNETNTAIAWSGDATGTLHNTADDS